MHVGKHECPVCHHACQYDYELKPKGGDLGSTEYWATVNEAWDETFLELRDDMHMSIEDIARRLGVTVEAVERRAKRHGLM